MTFEIQAHRGARAFYPENTIPAFCMAADLGCRVIELDLVVSRDHRIVISHDPWIVGNPGDLTSKRYLYTMPYETISGFDCGTPSPEFPCQKQIVASRPTLADMLREVEAHVERSGKPGEMIYNLEVKSMPGLEGIAFPEPSVYAALVVREILRSGLAHRIRLQSFDARIVAEAHRLAPELSYGFLVEDLNALDQFPDCLGFVPDFVNPHYSLVDRQLVEKLHGYGVRVIVWTVNLPEEMIRLKRLGVDGIITDHPEIAIGMRLSRKPG